MPLYGASEGIDAQRAANREALVGGLQAQKLMGDIAMQPSAMQYKQSLARVRTAEAEEKEASAASARKLAEIESQFMEQEAGARQQLTDAGKAQGKILTVEDLPASGSVLRASAADSLERLLAYSNGRLPPTATAGLRKQIADIHQKEAAAAANNNKAELEGIKTKVAQFEHLGNVAGAAALSPMNYASIMMDPQARQLLPQELTGNYQADRPILRAIEQASQDSIKRANLEREQADSEARRKLTGAQISKTQASIDLITARQQALKSDRELRAKYGGSTSQEAADLKKAQTALAKARTEALVAKSAPPLPLDPALVEVGKTYTGAGGQKYDIIGLDAKGNPIGRPHVQPAYTAPSAPKAALDGADDSDLIGDDDE